MQIIRKSLCRFIINLKTLILDPFSPPLVWKLQRKVFPNTSFRWTLEFLLLLLKSEKFNLLIFEKTCKISFWAFLDKNHRTRSFPSFFFYFFKVRWNFKIIVKIKIFQQVVPERQTNRRGVFHGTFTPWVQKFTNIGLFWLK